MKDPALALCTPATRGVWIDLLCAMHELDRSGELRGTTDQLARVARCSTVDLAHALTEFQATGAADVTERSGIVTVICRRMKREYDARKSSAERVKRFRSGSRNGDVAQKLRPPSSSSTSSSTSVKSADASASACRSDPEAGSLAAGDDPIVGTFPTRDGTWSLRRSKLRQWREAYPRLEVDVVIAKARQWLLDNPHRQKTARGMTSFLGKWLRREDERRPHNSDLSDGVHVTAEQVRAELEQMEREGVT